MIFPYVEFMGLTEERVFRPMIPISLKTNKESISWLAFLNLVYQINPDIQSAQQEEAVLQFIDLQRKWNVFCRKKASGI